MGKPLPLTLLGVMNPCHLHHVREMTRIDDSTDTLYKHEGSLCYTFHPLRVRGVLDLVLGGSMRWGTQAIPDGKSDGQRTTLSK
jgi:hypothetical protein